MSFNPQNRSDLLMGRPRANVLSSFMSRVYAWMMAGVAVTALVSYFVGQDQELVTKIFSNRPFFWGLVIVQLLSVVYLSAMVQRISTAAAGITFIIYSGLTGLTLSMIFMLYSAQSLAGAFITTTFAFGGLSLYGFMTKRDLGPVGSFCIMGLFGLIGLMLLSLLIPSLNSSGMQFVFNVAGIIIFAGLTAYDTQRIKAYAGGGNNLAILGALTLYLDFLNLFLSILRLGQRQ